MNRADTIELLQNVPYLSRLDSASLVALADVLTASTLPTNGVLYKQGQPGDSMVIVGTGRLSVRVSTAPGQAVTEVAVMYPGDVVGEMACVDPSPRSATVLATKPSIVFDLTRAVLDAVRALAPAVGVAIVGGVITHLARRIRETNDRIESALSQSGIARSSPGVSTPSAPAAFTAPSSRIDLKSLPCLASFTQEELKVLVKAAPPRAYSEGVTLCREGDPAASCYIIARGGVDVLRTFSGGTRCLACLGEGTLVGQMALVDRAPRSATLRTWPNTVLLELGREHFSQLLASASPFAVRFQDQIAVAGIRQLRSATARLQRILSDSAPTRPAVRQQAVPTSTTPAQLESPVQKRAEKDTLAYVQAALGEWGMSLSDLDDVRAVRTPGTMTAAERGVRARGV